MTKNMVRLGDICTVVSGSTPKTNISEYWDGDIKWITPAELNEDSFYLHDSVRHITDLGKEKTGLTYMPSGTVILSSRAPIGKTAIAACEMCCNQGFKNLICSDKIFNEYLYFFLSAKTEFLNSLGRGATFKEISKAIVENIMIPLPGIEDQKQIAARFVQIEDLIRLRKEQLQQLDQLVKSRFIELFGDLADPNCQWSALHLFEACESADDIKCGPFGTQLNKDEYQSTGVAVWEIPQINNGFTSFPTHFLTREKANQLSAYSLIPGDIAMSRKGNVGRCAVFPNNFPDGIIHSDVLRIRLDRSRVLPIFMMYQLHFSRAIQYQIESVSSGAIMAGINVGKLKNIIVFVPPIHLQEQFAAFVEQTDKLKLAVTEALAELETLKKSLMQQYFG